MNVAQYVANFLIEKGVRHVFGYQGGAILKLVDEFVATGKIEFIQNYHEQGSAFCADAYSRVTGNLGVALATSGPGATNLITGIVNANLDSIPTLFITGQDYKVNITNSSGARQNGFQDLDIVSIVKPATKYASLVIDPARIRYELEQAYFCATQGRPGAVLLDIPIDIQFAEIDPQTLEGFVSPAAPTALVTNISEVIRTIKAAKRPLILVGGGIRLGGAHEILCEFVQATNIPVISTLNGLDVYEGNYGFAGLYGNTAANLAAQNADLMIVLGARLGQRQVGKTPESYTKARIIHVDIDDIELKRVFADELAINTHIATFLAQMLPVLREVDLPDYSSWHQTICNWQKKYHINTLLNDRGLDPVRVVEEMLQLLSTDAILTNDVGQNQMWVAQAFNVKKGQRLLNSVGLGSMGFSLPAAIGAKFAANDRQVVSFMGDGGLQINIQELMLVGMRQLSLKCVVFNNKTLGMIREVQIRYYKANYHGANPQEFGCVDLKMLAQTYGLGYRLIESMEDIATLGHVFSDDLPYIIEVPLDLDTKLTNRYDEGHCFEAERIHD
ncbi:thiamine pyrophosphate-binding protein [Zwartia vadi]|uniref:thiamine pyrophosphate-binding protein n=1 Tax=Zwartia vadi TaxID=3058168 RepID=UPI0025B5E020|nr:thiamine pyrophosphate-binding protein [Zwartia vadi]MDN3987405.1 thiamine pyrophosphate-binding protein [Zwartia vadi]